MKGSKEIFMDERESAMNEMLSHKYPVSKKEIEIRASETVDNILENGDPLKVAESLSAIDQFIKSIRGNEKLVEYVREELVKNHGRLQLPTGTRIESAEVGIKYDYSSCGDTVWEYLTSQKNGLEQQIKERETFLKTVPAKGLIVTDELTGETTTIYPPTKTSTSSYKVLLQK